MSETTAIAAAPISKEKIFLRRLLSFIVLWGVVIGALFFTGKTVSDYTFLFRDAAARGIWSCGILRAGRQREIRCFNFWGTIGGLLLTAGTFFHLQGFLGLTDSPSRVNDFETGFLILFRARFVFATIFFAKQHDRDSRHLDDAVRPDVCSVAAELHPENLLFPFH